MLVVLPFYSGDHDRMVKLLEWLALMDSDSLKHHEALLWCPYGTQVKEMHELSLKSFGVSSWAGYGEIGGAYPMPQNNAWQQAARYLATIQKGPWLWMESDAVPTKPGWLDIIENAHKIGGKPFSGHVVTNKHMTDSHMTGVGIYPNSVYGHIENGLMARSKPFDVVSGLMDGVLSKVHRINDLIQHIPEQDHHFDSRDCVDSILHPETVLFHKCKDGSLIDVLSGNKRSGGIIPSVIDKIKKSCALVEKTCLIQLRRFGDIINILPIAYDMFNRTGVKTSVMVHKDFVSILEGAKYCEPIIWGGDMEDVKSAEANAQASGKYKNVLITQVTGKEWTPERKAQSYAEDSWRLAGCLQQRGSIPLIFDQRDKKRESALIKRVLGDRKNAILFVGKSFSSPFPHSEHVIKALQSKFDMVDISDVKADRVYDMIGLFEHARALVTCDTMHWHLSAVHPIPVIAFRSDAYGSWHGSPDTKNTVISIPYKEVLGSIPKIIHTLEKIMSVHAPYPKSDTNRPKIPVTLIGLNTMPEAMETVISLLYSMRLARFDQVVMMTDLSRNNLTDILNRNGITPFHIPHRIGRENYEIDQLTKLHHCFHTSHCIFQEADGGVLNPWAWKPEWLEYDYIGAPWSDRNDLVGNGGFSLRSHKWCNVMSSLVKPGDAGFSESDYYACVRLRDQTVKIGLAIAPYDVAQRFACEDRIYSGEFGAHGSDTIRQNGWNWEQRSIGLKS